MHELGHVKGAGHSADSQVMKWNYPSATKTDAAAKDDWNKAGPVEAPNADDIALNKLLHAKTNAIKKSKSEGSSSATPSKSGWVYEYFLHALTGPDYVDPVTRFIVEIGPGVDSAHVRVTQLPSGWQYEFVPREPPDRSGGGGKPTETEEGLMSAALIFFTPSLGSGVFPGNSASFQVTSPFGPGPTKINGYTNSPNFDSDEFILFVPSNIDVPTVSVWGLGVMAVLVLAAGTVVVRRRRAAGA